jgi:hypothetical protein
MTDVLIRDMAARDIVQVAAIGNAASELQASATDVFWS